LEPKFAGAIAPPFQVINRRSAPKGEIRPTYRVAVDVIPGGSGILPQLRPTGGSAAVGKRLLAREDIAKNIPGSKVKPGSQRQAEY
jgi:hypothetical protein